MKRALKRRDTPGKQERLLVWVLVDGNWFRIYSVMATRSGWDFDFFSASYPVGVANYFIRWNFCVDQYLFLVSFLRYFLFFFPSFSKGEEEEEEKFKSGGRQEDAHMALVIPSSHGRFTLKYLYLFMMKYIIIRGRCKICI